MVNRERGERAALCGGKNHVEGGGNSFITVISHHSTENGKWKIVIIMIKIQTVFHWYI